MLLPHCATQEESREYLSELTANNPGAVWVSVVRAIEIRNHPGSVGLCGIAIQRGSEQGEIWYLVKPDHWGQGIATMAARELLRIGFSEMNLHRLCATCLPENPASVRVLEKIGMRREGYHFRNLKIHGVWRDCFLYAILREEWESLMRHKESKIGSQQVEASKTDCNERRQRQCQNHLAARCEFRLRPSLRSRPSADSF